MDPNATLAELRRIAQRNLENEGDLGRMAELFEALDNWILNGGFLPNNWNKNNHDRAQKGK